MNWTIASVKDELPSVPILVSGKVQYTAAICGRQNAFATVWVRIGGAVHEWEFAWKTIVDALNNGTPLRTHVF